MDVLSPGCSEIATGLAWILETLALNEHEEIHCRRTRCFVSVNCTYLEQDMTGLVHLSSTVNMTAGCYGTTTFFVPAIGPKMKRRVPLIVVSLMSYWASVLGCCSSQSVAEKWFNIH